MLTHSAMPSCRRDQTKFAAFLALLVTVEVISIVTLMHIEHRKAARRSGGYEEELQLVVPHMRRSDEHKTVVVPGEKNGSVLGSALLRRKGGVRGEG